MTPLKNAFAQARYDGLILPVLEPFLAANLYIVGAIDGDGRPNITLKNSPNEGRFCATVSEDSRWLEDVPSTRILRIRGKDLLHVLGDGKDVVVVYADGGDLLDAEDVEAFRAAIE